MNCHDPRHSNMEMTAKNHTNDIAKWAVELNSMHCHNLKTKRKYVPLK
jgi:hypothetical protein